MEISCPACPFDGLVEEFYSVSFLPSEQRWIICKSCIDAMIANGDVEPSACSPHVDGDYSCPLLLLNVLREFTITWYDRNPGRLWPLGPLTVSPTVAPEEAT